MVLTWFMGGAPAKEYVGLSHHVQVRQLKHDTCLSKRNSESTNEE